MSRDTGSLWMLPSGNISLHTTQATARVQCAMQTNNDEKIHLLCWLGCIPFFSSLFLETRSLGIPCLEEFRSSYLWNPARTSFPSQGRFLGNSLPLEGNSLFVPVHACVRTGKDYLPEYRKGHLPKFHHFCKSTSIMNSQNKSFKMHLRQL